LCRLEGSPFKCPSIFLVTASGHGRHGEDKVFETLSQFLSEKEHNPSSLTGTVDRAIGNSGRNFM
jgi:hypothetical protein